MVMISTDGGARGRMPVVRTAQFGRSTRLAVTTHQALYTTEYKDITRSQVNACQRNMCSAPRDGSGPNRLFSDIHGPNSWVMADRAWRRDRRSRRAAADRVRGHPSKSRRQRQRRAGGLRTWIM